MENIYIVSHNLCDDLLIELRSYLNDHPLSKIIKEAKHKIDYVYGPELLEYGFAKLMLFHLWESDSIDPPVPYKTRHWMEICNTVQTRRNLKRLSNELKYQCERFGKFENIVQDNTSFCDWYFTNLAWENATFN